MDPAGRFRKLAVKRGLTPGTLHDACPEDFDLLLLSLRREFADANARELQKCAARKAAWQQAGTTN